MKRQLLTAAAAAAVLLSSTWASAGPIYSFYRITGNAATDIAAQLSVQVNDGGTVGTDNFVNFVFRNNVGTDSSISEIYFDDGTLLGISNISYAYTGVQATSMLWDQTVSPPELPGGPPDFVSTVGYKAESSNPSPANGVNEAVDELTIRFKLLAGKNYSDTLAAIAGGVDLRIGMHAQSIGSDGDSDSFLNVSVVPLPAAAWMGMALMGSVGGVGYFRKRRQVEIL